MKMNTEIRIQIDRTYSSLYTELKGFAVRDMHELFFICSCIGYKERKRVPLNKPEDKFWSKTISPKEWSCYYSMVIVDNVMNYEAISNDEDVIRIIQEYANSGIEILIDELLESYIIGDKCNPTLDKSACEFLANDLIYYLIYEKRLLKE